MKRQEEKKMTLWKKALVLLTVFTITASLCGCGAEKNAAAVSLTFDEGAWQYDADNDVYWQINVVYCGSPAADAYESFGIYVPGAYLDGEDNGDGTYTCTVNDEGEVNGYTAATAPLVLPVNTAGYAAQEAPTEYSYRDASDYLEAGFIYVYAGCRGRDNGENSDGSAYDGGAPWGVTDLKAAIRYLRYNEDVLPGDSNAVFVFGHSGGGAQCAVLGASGDSDLYTPYLEAIGAAMTDKDGNALSDAVCGAMCWCPITALDEADEAYEWMMGQYSDSGTRSDDTWTSALSDDLAEAYAAYINDLGLTAEDGTVLTLAASGDGIYTDGTYYEYLLNTIETSLNHFLADTAFPYTSGGGSGDGEPSGAPDSRDGSESDSAVSTESSQGNGADSGEKEGPPSGEKPSGGKPSDDKEKGSSDEASFDGEASVTYETAQDYIDALNGDEEWIRYDAASNTASITDVAAFVKHCKNASKDVAAFDDLDREQAENKVFGTGESDALHFDSVLAGLLAENGGDYAAFGDYNDACAAEYAADLEETDSLGVSSLIRQAMYNPMYFLCDGYDGAGTSSVAPYWRIRSGIEQSDTSLTTEMNLALALAASGAADVDFETVWGQGHTTAERTGDSTENLIDWIGECLK